MQFRGSVCGWLGRGSGSGAPCLGRREKKCGKLESCSKSQSFFAGINLVQAGGSAVSGCSGEKNQTFSSTLPDSARVSWLNYFLNFAGIHFKKIT
jgi:hypothetical protein